MGPTIICLQTTYTHSTRESFSTYITTAQETIKYIYVGHELIGIEEIWNHFQYKNVVARVFVFCFVCIMCKYMCKYIYEYS